MSVQPAGTPEPYEVIHGGALEEADIEAMLVMHDEWVRAGRQGARCHDDVMAELLNGR